MGKLGSLAVSVLLCTSLLVPVGAAAAAPDAPRQMLPGGRVSPVDPSSFDYGTGTAAREYFVRVAGTPAAVYTGGVAGQPATAQRQADGTYGFDGDARATAAYREHLAEAQASVLSAGEAAVGRELTVTGSFTVANHGFTTTLTPAEARELGQVDGVTWLQQVPDYEPHTDAGPAWVRARGDDAVWQRPADGGLASGAFLGEGVVVGIIDTGINPANPSFADVSADGYDHTNPRGEGTHVGSCDPTNVPGGAGEGTVLRDFGFEIPDGAHHDADLAAWCNDKLIGMWGYHSVTGEYAEDGSVAVPGTPIDYDGHGSHTAGTAAGGFVDDVSATTPVPVPGNVFDLSGVAPRANIISYGACCTGAALYSAVDQLLIDGVDVVNYSIGSTSPTPNLLQDPVTYGFLVARQNGVHVASSAGNAGPLPETIGSPADAPWLTVVASTTHDRLNGNVVGGFADAGGPADLADIVGKGNSPALPTPTPIVYAGDLGNPTCRWNETDDPTQPHRWDADTFDGQIVVCDRGVNGRVEKSEVAAAAGAGGFVLANDEANAGSVPGSLNGDSYPIPGVHITYADGVELKAWLAEATAPVAVITGTVYERDERYGDVVSVFSSRGPNAVGADVLSPHVTAPGHDILAPYGAGNVVEYQFVSGTSMASPHVAGALALLDEAFGDTLSPAQVQSALQLTARRDVVDTDGRTPADPYDVGSGHIDVAAALATGLVLDETFEGYVEAITTGDATSLNVASLVQSQCAGRCSWTRTVTAPEHLSGPVSWTAVAAGDGFSATVTPASFTLAPGESVELTVTADVRELTVGGPDAFGSLELTTDAGEVSDAHLPMVVRPSLFAGSTALELTSEGYDDEHVEPYSLLDPADLQLTVDGLAPATVAEEEVAQDPTNGDAFDDLDDVHVAWFAAELNTQRVLARILETSAPDLDLFLGYDADDERDVDAGELIAVSASSGSEERVELSYPDGATLPAGNWWVVVQNWEASSDTAADPFTLVTAAQRAGDVGNLEASTADDLSEGGPFDLRLDWALARDATYWIGAVTMGSGAGSPDDIGRIELDLLVAPQPPVADAGGPYSTALGDEVVLDASGSTHPEGTDLTGFVWDLTELGVDGLRTGETVAVEPRFIGEFEVSVTVTDADGGEATDTAVVTVTSSPGVACQRVDRVAFSDVSGGVHGGNVGCVAGFGIAQGRGDGTYGPAADVQRGQMASFLTRLLRVAGVELPAAPERTFSDVTGGPHATAIAQLADLGIAEGREGGTFGPSRSVTRAQMASFLVRSLEVVLDRELSATGAGSFTDVGGTHADNIRVASELAIAQGRTVTTYAPNRDVRRDQMASFLARSLDVLLGEGTELTPLD